MKNPFPKTAKRQRRHARSKARMSGTALRPRLIVFRSLNNNYAQLIDDETGKTLVAANDLKAKKAPKTDRAKAVGMDLAAKAKKAGIEACVFDRNGYKYHGRIKAIAEGAREGGLNF